MTYTDNIDIGLTVEHESAPPYEDSERVRLIKLKWRKERVDRLIQKVLAREARKLAQFVGEEGVRLALVTFRREMAHEASLTAA